MNHNRSSKISITW